MTEPSCIIVTYTAVGQNQEEMIRHYVLNEIYAQKFHVDPIKQLNIRYLDDFGWTYSYVMANLHCIEHISNQTYDIIARLKLLTGEHRLQRMLDVTLEDNLEDID